jgi:hypothetical protein
MITFISEQRDTPAGQEWIEVDSMHSDICVFSIGLTENDGSEDHAVYSCISFDLYRLHSFTKESKEGDSFTMEWCADDDSHYQKCTVVDLGDEFMVDIIDSLHTKTQDFDKQYSYFVNHETLVEAAKNMHDLYLSINNEVTK